MDNPYKTRERLNVINFNERYTSKNIVFENDFEF